MVLLWGDSHAGHLYPAMAELADRRRLAPAQWTAASCPPTTEPLIGESATCGPIRAWAWQTVVNLRPETALIAGAWPPCLEQGLSEDLLLDQIETSVRRLQAAGVSQVIVMGPAPIWNTSLPADLFRQAVLDGGRAVPQHAGRVSPQLLQFDARLAQRVQVSRGTHVLPLQELCSSKGCRTIGDPDRQPLDLLFWDRDHLTLSGARIVIDSVARHRPIGNR